MKRSRKHTSILALMVISQILLTAFVVQWLRSQYNDENKRLAEEMFNTFMDTQDQLIDTLLFKNYVGPVLSHNGDRTIMIAIDDTMEKGKMPDDEKKIERSVRSEGRKEAVMIRMNRNPDSSMKSIDTATLKKVNNDFLLRSVKMIVSHSKNSEDTSAVIRNLNIHPDTAAFRQNFSRKLEERGMKFDIRLGDRNQTGMHHLSGKIFINPGSPFSMPGVEISNYQGFIIKNILPQILFGGFLILITAIAFLLSFRSLREHIIFNDMRNEFISNMTHELKTPVATIGIALESLGKYNMKDNPEVMTEYLRLAASETKRLEDLISRVLDHSALENNARPENMVVADINPILREIISIMRPGIKEGKIILNESEKPLNVMFDPLLIKGVIINLVDNSIKYCDKPPSITVSSGKEQQSAVIIVSDNGPGIPFEYQAKIFEKFFRLPTGNVHNVKGYGLGLSFASLVVKLHRGTISVRNNDVGCSFIIKLPIV